jgi:hypothetical protein
MGRFNINFAFLAEDSNIGLVGMCKCHDLHVVGPSSALGHLNQMALESHVQLVLGCSREVQAILGRDAPSRFPLRGTTLRNLDGQEWFEHLGMLPHILGHSLSDLQAPLLVTINLVGEGIEEAISYVRKEKVLARQLYKTIRWENIGRCEMQTINYIGLTITAGWFDLQAQGLESTEFSRRTARHLVWREKREVFVLVKWEMEDGDGDGRWEKFLFLRDGSMRRRKLARESFLKRKKLFIGMAGSSPYSNSMMDINNSCIIQSRNSPFGD